MSETTAVGKPVRLLRGIGDVGPGLAIGLIALGLLFQAEIAAAVKTWFDSTAYNHCFLVIPIALYLIWDRRASLRGLSAMPIPLVALLALPLGIVWLAAERLGIMEGRQLVAITMVEVLFLAMLGFRLWYALLGPLLYLYFLVPFGEFLTPKLQDVTTWFTRHGLDLLGIPAYIDGYVIEIREGTFFVAEACAGLRFLIASIAFGVLYALLMYRGPVRRTLFIVASIILPIVANGFRALGIVALGHVLGSADAAAADHVLYGWMFFSLVILLLILAGLPFRQDEQQAKAPGASPSKDPVIHDLGIVRRGLLAGIGVAALATLGPVTALGLNQASAAPAMVIRPLDLSPSCENQGAAVSAGGFGGQGIIQRIVCDGTVLNVQVEVFSPRSTAAPVNAERRRLTRFADADDLAEGPLTATSGARLPPWRLIRANQPVFVAVVGLWIDGEPSSPGIAMRLSMARTSVTGGAYAPVLVAFTPAADWAKVDMPRRQELENQIAALLEDHPRIGEQIRAIANGGR